MVILLHPFFELPLAGTPTPLPSGQPQKKGGNTTIGNKTSLGHQCVNVAFATRECASFCIVSRCDANRQHLRPWHSAFRSAFGPPGLHAHHAACKPLLWGIGCCFGTSRSR